MNNLRAARALRLVAAAGILLVILSCSTYQAPPVFGARSPLSLEYLNSDKSLREPVDMAWFMPPVDHAAQGPGIQGVLTVHPVEGTSRLEIIEDRFGIAQAPELRLAEFPPFSMSFTSDGNAVIPAVRTPQRSQHPYWELMLAPGVVWPDPAGKGWLRVSLPFALKEKNQNCTHNGVMAFAIRPDGAVSRLAWQISSETCLYLKLNLWGTMPADFQPQVLAAGAQLIMGRRDETAARMPVRSVTALQSAYPGIDVSRMVPRSRQDMSVWGFVIDGVHYRSDCPTRHGPYPFCDELALPSYSLAKSIFAGLFYLHMIREWPEFAAMTASELVPECRLPDGRWNDVTMAHLVSMSTGNYDDISFGRDEDAEKMQEFFLAESHEGKIRFACEAWPRQSTPGTEAVYHTTDDYLLGTAMNAFLRRKDGEKVDVYRDYLHPRLLAPLNLSPLMRWTQRTYDEAAQPFTAYGLEMLADDLVRIANSLKWPEQAPFEPTALNQALFRDTGGALPVPAGRGEAYRNGFWGSDKAEPLGCENETWIPFMSGYGGIIVALMPNDTIYYYFSDSGVHWFTDAALESHKTRSMCKE